MLLSAAILVPLAFDSTPVVAQGRGQERAAVVTTQFQPHASAQGEAHRQDEAPPGLMDGSLRGSSTCCPRVSFPVR
jgi:hypothetical protein